MHQLCNVVEERDTWLINVIGKILWNQPFVFLCFEHYNRCSLIKCRFQMPLGLKYCFIGEIVLFIFCHKSQFSLQPLCIHLGLCCARWKFDRFGCIAFNRRIAVNCYLWTRDVRRGGGSCGWPYLSELFHCFLVES